MRKIKVDKELIERMINLLLETEREDELYAGEANLLSILQGLIEDSEQGQQ